MKTKQTKIDRSAAKWLPGAMALAATTASTQAAVVQITLVGNKISTTGGNQLVADLTGDNIDDISIGVFGIGTSFVVGPIGDGFVRASHVSVGYGFQYYVVAQFAYGGVGTGWLVGEGRQEVSYLNPIKFTDPRINGGVSTKAWLEVKAFNSSATNHTVELSRLIFDDASVAAPVFGSIPGVQTEWSAVPEPSSLALLALGAGGLLARRRRAA